MLEKEASFTRAFAEDPRTLLLAAPMSRHQMAAISVTFALCALDGFDVLAITFAAPALAIERGIGKAALGYVLGAGLLGMAGGSLLLAPAADLLGRRRLIYVSLAMMMLGTFWTAISNGIVDLLLSRLLTGLGVGAMISVINPLASEYANARRRDAAVTLMNIGYPVGAVVGGMLATYLLPAFGWRAIFITASLLGAVELFFVWRYLSEPIAYIIARPGKDALARVNAYLKRCELPIVTELPPPPSDAARLPVAKLFRDGMTSVTLTMTCIYFFFVMSVFYMQTWVPTLVAGAGISPSKAAFVSACLSFGGILGALCIAATTARFGLKPVVITAMAGGAIFLILFGVLPPSLFLFAVGAGVTGFFLFGGMSGVYAVIARTFPAHMRASGSGFVIGIGRLGAALSPALAGYLFAAGLGRPGVGVIMAAPALLAATVLLGFMVRPPTTA